jgi:hypothetical protein
MLSFTRGLSFGAKSPIEPLESRKKTKERPRSKSNGKHLSFDRRIEQANLFLEVWLGSARIVIVILIFVIREGQHESFAWRVCLPCLFLERIATPSASDTFKSVTSLI